MIQASSRKQAVPAQSLGGLVAALIAGGITAILDTTIVAIGIRTLATSLNVSLSTIQWVSTGYLLALAIAIPFTSWAQARIGGKRLWLLALTVFVVGSTLCACSWNAGSLIAFRVLQGLGGGIMMPLMQTLAMQNVPPDNRTRTMANISIPAALGPILGPVLGGIVLNWLSWRWLFLINVPIGIVGLVLAFIFIVDDYPGSHANAPKLDVVGALLMAPSLALLLYGLSKSSGDGGFSQTGSWLPICIGAILLAGYVAWARRKAGAALIDIRLLGIRSVRVSAIGLTCIGATIFAGNFLLPLYFQGLRQYTVLNAALLLIPQGVSTFLARFVVGQLVERFGPRMVCVFGSLVIAVATVPFAFAGTATSLWYLGAALFVRGFGLGVVFIPLMTTAFADIERERMPHASAITRIVQQLGGAFGTAVIAVVLESQISGATSPTAAVSGFRVTFWVTIAITVVAACSGMFLPGKERVVGKA